MREVQKKNTFFFLDSRTWVPWTVRSEVRLSEWNSKEKHFFLWNSRTRVPTQKALNTINFSLLFMGYLENYRIFIIPNLGVLYILQNTETIRIPLVSRLLPVLFRQSPTSWYSIKAQIKTSCSIKKISIIKLNNIKYQIKTAKTLAFRGCHVVSL